MLFLHELPEKVPGIPVRALRLLRYFITYGQIYAGAFDCRVEIERLTHVITGLMITLCFPIELHLLAIEFRSDRLQSFADVQSGNTLQDEGILVAANEVNLFRHGIWTDGQAH